MAALLPETEPQRPVRRLTDRAICLWRAVHALPPELARAQLALFVGDAVQLVADGSVQHCAIARRVDSLAPVARALGQPVEVEGWDGEDGDAPVAWRGAVLPLAAEGAALRVVSRFAWPTAPAFTSALPAVG